MSAVDVRGLRKSFGGVEVLHGVDLDIPAGSLTAVLGPSGCGKTTLLRVIAGFERPDGGTVRVGGTEVAGEGVFVAPERRKVGYVPQEGALFPHLDVAANVAFGLKGGAGRNRDRVHVLLEVVGLDAGFAGRYPHQLSGGQQQRIALARSLAPEPDVVLLDEPFSSLDANLRDATRQAVADALLAAGSTALLVTHDQGEALSMADQVAVMGEGRIRQVASPPVLYGQPANAAVARFVGEANLLDGVLEVGGVRTALGVLAAVPVDTPGTAGGAATGAEPVTVVVRPEQLRVTRLTSDGTGGDALMHPDGVGGITGVVQRVAYFGHDALLTVEIPGSESTMTLAARVPATTAAYGDRVTLTVTGPVMVFPSSE